MGSTVKVSTSPPTSLPARLIAAAALLLAIAAVGAASSSADSPTKAATAGVTPSTARPAPPAGSNRLISFSKNLDRDRVRERVLVYNLPTGLLASTWFDVWNRTRKGWSRVQRTRILLSPGASSSGLRKAWLGDLNRDGRAELAVRNSITGSVGQTLTVLRQRSRRVPRFNRLQDLGGDWVGLRRIKAGPAVVLIYRRSNHSSDNREHNERWRWSQRKYQWACVFDCMPMP